MNDRRSGRPYMDPYLAGVGIGCVLLAAFVVMGHGLGASGAFSSVVASGVAIADSARAASNDAYAGYLPGGPASVFRDWFVLEIAGVFLGGMASALLAGRFRRAVDRGPRISSGARLVYAFGGGAVMGLGAKLARGCTSGLALTGGAVFSVGSWIFIAGAFGAGYLFAPLFRRQWL